MKHLFFIAFVLFLSVNLFAQIPTDTLVQIVKAEDERRFDSTLETLLKNPNTKVRERTVLAIGRIGEENSLSALEQLLATEKDETVRTMIMFAIGEIESLKGAETILKTLQNPNDSSEVLARAVEAAGKIAALNAKDESAKKLGAAILERLDFENRKRSAPFENIVLLGLTAVLRARPEGGDKIVAEFLGYSNARIRADALNTLARLRSKIANEKVRELLAKDTDANVRANAARLLGVAEDKEALDLLVNAATKDSDSRVRVSAIRALAGLKDASVAEKLIPVVPFRAASAATTACLVINRAKKLHEPVEACQDFESEFIEIATTLGRLLPNTNNQKAIDFLQQLRQADNYESPETEIALARIAPKNFLDEAKNLTSLRANGNKPSWRALSSFAQALGEFANLPDEKKNLRKEAAILANGLTMSLRTDDEAIVFALPDFLQTFVKLRKDLDFPPLPNPVGKVSNDEIAAKALRDFVKFRDKEKPRNDFLHSDATDIGFFDPIVRATAAGLLENQPPSKENIEALKTAFDSAFIKDTHDNDAQLAILDALFKLDKKEALPTLIVALDSKDYLVRKRAFGMLKDDSFKDSELVKIRLERFLADKKNQVLPYSSGTKLGQVLNTNADYIRAVSRKNGTVKAVLTTTKGTFTINFTPEDAPLTVDNFIKLAKSNYFNGVTVHRVVPNFVMQDGDPRGDGNGGPGWSIRCEVNMLGYGRGAVGMALSGKDTGGSQWFVTHSPQPHLDGGYTVFGYVNETEMKVVDSIVRGDKIISVKIIGEPMPKVVRKTKQR